MNRDLPLQVSSEEGNGLNVNSEEGLGTPTTTTTTPNKIALDLLQQELCVCSFNITLFDQLLMEFDVA